MKKNFFTKNPLTNKIKSLDMESFLNYFVKPNYDNT